RKCPFSSVVNDAASVSLFSTAKVAFASGAEPAPILVGPGLAGLIVMIPSIPDPPPEGVCPVEAQTAIAISQKTVITLRDRTMHYIGVPSRWSTTSRHISKS